MNKEEIRASWHALVVVSCRHWVDGSRLARSIDRSRPAFSIRLGLDVTPLVWHGQMLYLMSTSILGVAALVGRLRQLHDERLTNIL